jgi:hypothetical protein
VAVDAVTQAYGQLIVDHAARIKIPVLYASREFVDAGGLMTYPPSRRSRAARMRFMFVSTRF